MPTNAERDRPRSAVLDLLYYGLRILRQLIVDDSSNSLSKKMVNWEGMKVFA